jgi:integrase
MSKPGPRARPRYRKLADRWEVKVDGRYVPILDRRGEPIRGDTAESEERALRCWPDALNRTRAASRGEDDELELAVVFDLFLDWVETKRPTMYERYQRTCQSFVDAFPGLRVRDLTADHVDQWFRKHPEWKSSSTRRAYLTLVVTALNWAAKPSRRHIPYAHPLRDMEDKPRRRRRSAATRVDDLTHVFALQNCHEDFRPILVALRNTGTRPGNICRVTRKHFLEDPGVWVFEEANTAPGDSVHKTYEATGEPLIVPLTPEMVELCKQLIARLPEGEKDGPLFRTSSGRPWTPNRISVQLDRYRRTWRAMGVPIPEVYYAYCYRHQLATGTLERGESEAIVAAMLGHKGTKTLHANYNHVLAKADTLVNAIRRHVKPLPLESLTPGGGDEGREPPRARETA